MPGKTLMWDSAVLWDCDLWLADFFAVLTRNRDPESLLWTANVTMILEWFSRAWQYLGLHHLHPSR